MNLNSTITKTFLKKKIATVLFVTVSFVAFATLGDDSGKKGKKAYSSELLPYNAKNFSLRSNYAYKSNNLFSEPEKKNFIMLNPIVTYQKGNSSFVLPLKKMPFSGKIRFTSTPQKN